MRVGLAFGLALVVVLLAGCGGPIADDGFADTPAPVDETPTDTPEATPTPDEEATPTPDEEATPTPDGEATPTPEAEDDAEAAPSPTPTPESDDDTEVTPTPTATPTPEADDDPEATPTPTPTPEPEAAVQLDECTTIDEPGVYELTTDLEDRDEEVCLQITSGDVVLEGNDHLVGGVGAADTVGVEVRNPDEDDVENVTVRNLRVEDWGDGILVGEMAYLGSIHVDFEDVEASHNEGVGISVTGYASADFQGVTANHNGDAGINAFDGRIDGLRDVTANRNGAAGISGYDSGEIAIDGVTVSENDGSGLSFSDPTVLEGTDLVATENGGDGASLGIETVLDVSNAEIADNDGAGVSGADDGGVVLRDAVVRNNGEEGIAFDHGGVTLEDALVEDNGGSGVFLRNSDADLTETTIRDNDGWQLEVEDQNDWASVTASDLGIGDHAVFDFDDESVSLDTVPEGDLPALPEDAESVGDGVEVRGLDGSATMTLEYDLDAVEGDTVELWRHVDDEWSSIGTYDAAETDGSLTEELTSDGVHAPVENGSGSADGADDQDNG